MDMNSLLSGLAESQKNGSNSNKNCGCNNNGNGGGNSIVWIIVLLLIFCSQGQAPVSGTVCGCKPKHCKEYCRCGVSEPVGYGGGLGLGGLGGGCGGFGGGSGIWIIILILLFACTGNNGRNNKGCTNNIINLDSCDEE